jgi:hypothetical protein
MGFCSVWKNSRRDHDSACSHRQFNHDEGGVSRQRGERQRGERREEREERINRWTGYRRRHMDAEIHEAEARGVFGGEGREERPIAPPKQ